MSAFGSRPKFSFFHFIFLLLLLLHLESSNCILPYPGCEETLYPDLCVSTLSSIPDLASQTLPQIISASVNATIKIVQSSASNCTQLQNKLRNTLAPLEQRAIDDCVELFGYTVYGLQSALSNMLNTSSCSSTSFHDIQTLLSAAMTNQYTCLDGFGHSHINVRTRIEKPLYEITRLLSNSLAMLNNISQQNFSRTVDVSPEHGKMVRGFPEWVSRKDRKLLATPVSEIKYDLLVAKDGTGDFTTISEAVNAAPNATKHRFVIRIKAGGYFENVEVPSKKTNLMFVGDGIGNTVVKAGRNVFDGWTTFQSATLAVVGDGFIARDITIENYAGPSKHQAVALRSGSDRSAFYRCSFVGYQDTLYVHSFRQFFKNCDIYGTIDVVFGNAAVVLQKCNLYALKPEPEQKNVFTAQGREDPNQNSGISIINCKLAAAADLLPVQSSFKTYLGRPWKNHSRTVIIKSQLDDLIDPAGWLEWDGDFALRTLYYGEYKNKGPGSHTTKRVTWPGYRMMNKTEAKMFTVPNFILGDDWLPAYNISYSTKL